jgi:hypothetical protein
MIMMKARGVKPDDGYNLATQSIIEDQNKDRLTYYKTRLNEVYWDGLCENNKQ